MYADDTTILCSASDALTLQTELDVNLNRLAYWFKENKLTLNIKKTKLMVFGSKYNLQNFQAVSLKYGNDVVERVDSFKYLGVVFDPNLSWSHHINYVSSTVSKRIGIIRSVKYYLPPCTLNMLANALVMPHFDYCSIVWSNCNSEYSNTLQVLQNRLARILLNADIKTSVNDLMGTLNWVKLNCRWNDQLLLLVFKCLTGSAPSYLSSQFSFTNSMHSHNTRGQTFNSLVVPTWKLGYGKRTFQYRATKLWNDLPQNVRFNFTTLSTSTFKTAISSNQ